MFSNLDSNIDAQYHLNSASVIRDEKTGDGISDGRLRQREASSREASEGNREAVRVMVIGSTPGVEGVIKSLHRLGFAEAGDWSKPQTYPNSDREMRILTKWQA